MTTRTMSEPQMARFTRSMQEQGVGVLRTKKGLLLRLPNGESTAVHFTNSDVRAHDNLIARLRKAGVRHPDDRKDVAQLPAQITTGSVAPGTKRKIEDALRELNYPDAVRVQQMREMTGLEHITVSKGLHALGFTPVIGKRNARDWMTPPDMLDLRVQETEPESPTFSEPDVERVLEAATEGMGQPEPDVKQENGREFIDSHDSWVVDLSRVPKAVGRYMEGLAAAGLQAEIRVWKQ